MTILPNLIIVGAAKSGTTTIFNNLKRNPKIFIPDIKECRFFSQMPTNFKGGEAALFQNKGPRDIYSYLELFINGKNKFNIDISNDYFYYFKKSIINIKKTYKNYNLREPKILIILRNPVERVFSMYHHSLRLNSEYLDFDKAFELSKERKKQNYAWMFDLQTLGMSYEPCKAYLENFISVKILLFEEFQKNIMNSIYEFIELDNNENYDISFSSNTNDYNLPRNFFINIVLSKIRNILLQTKFSSNKEGTLYKNFKKIYKFILRKNKRAEKNSLNKFQKEKLINFYRKDILKLSNLIKKDLEHWLNYK